MLCRNSSVLLGLLLLAGCDVLTDPQPRLSDLAFGTDRTLYSPGDSIEARLVNQSSSGIAYNLCFTRIERSTATGWIEVATFGAGLCNAVLVGLEAGGSAQHRAVLPRDFEAGTYRLSTPVGMGAQEPTVLASTAFVVDAR